MPLSNIRPDTAGGCLAGRNVALAATGATLKGNPGQVYGWHFGNAGASAAFVKLYNTAGVPNVGVTVPFITILVPAGGSVTLGIPQGIAFSSGIGWAATGAAADADTSAPSGAVIANLFYF